MRFLLLFTTVAVTHTTLLRLPYFWDEGGYYVPAALDFYHRWTLIPAFTNAHPPLPNVVLATVWRVFGVGILATRLTACAFAAAALFAVYELGSRTLGKRAAIALVCLTGVYPIWFAQSSLAHADIFAAAFTLAALAVYLTAAPASGPGTSEIAGIWNGRYGWTAAFFCLAVLSKETALLQPLTLAGLELWFAVRAHDANLRRAHLRWVASFSAALPVLALWFAYHRWETGFTFGNPTFLRYNATANFTLDHIVSAFAYRFVHLFWQRNIWLPVVLALGCLLLPRRPSSEFRSLPERVLVTISVLLAANWIAFSVLGGALLTRYLLPVYPLTLLVCLWIWASRTAYWPALAALTGAAFISALWINPPTYFAPEDNLTYRDMIVVHQEAIAYLQQHDPNATVLTAWPAAAELTRPELGYTDHPFKVFQIDDFTRAQVARVAGQPGSYDAALVFATHYASPSLRRYLLAHPTSRRGRKYLAQRDLTPAEIAVRLGGRVAWQDDRDGEWAAVLRFDRRYNAELRPPQDRVPAVNQP